jgi:dynein heavy chain
MIIGPTESGKIQVFKTLAAACTNLSKKDKEFSSTRYNILNPKSITMGQLYGEFNPDTHEWANSILSEIIKICSEDEGPDVLWIVLDGPVDALWI